MRMKVRSSQVHFQITRKGDLHMMQSRAFPSTPLAAASRAPTQSGSSSEERGGTQSRQNNGGRGTGKGEAPSGRPSPNVLRMSQGALSPPRNINNLAAAVMSRKLGRVRA